MDWWLLISVNCLVYSMAVHTYLAKVMKDEAERLEAEAEKDEEEAPTPKAWSRPNSVSPNEEKKARKIIAQDLLKKKLKKHTMTKPEWVNYIGKLGFIIINVLNNVIIGIVALVEYLKKSEDYLDYDH